MGAVAVFKSTHASGGGNALESYAVVRGDDKRLRVAALDTRDVHDIQCLRDSVKGDFIWFKKDGKSYLVKDPALVAKARAAWAPTEKLGAEMEKQSSVASLRSKELDAIGAKIGASTAALVNEQMQRDTSVQMNALARTQERLGRRLEELGERMAHTESPVRREALSRQMDLINRQMEPLQQRMSRLAETMARDHEKMDVNREPMKSLHAAMAELVKPMEEVGRKLGEMGREQGRLSREADQATRALIDEALRKGQATVLGRNQG